MKIPQGNGHAMNDIAALAQELHLPAKAECCRVLENRESPSHGRFSILMVVNPRPEIG
jgi:hypothetical protein